MSLRIATFNVLDLFEHDPYASVLPAKIAFIAETLRRADADVVALQEIGSDGLLSRLVSEELASLRYTHVRSADGDRRGIRNAIFTRLPVLFSHVHAPASLPFPRFVDTDPEPFGQRIPMRRGVVHLRVESDIGPVDVMTVHFKSKLGRAMQDAAGSDVIDVSARGYAEAQLRSLVLRSAEALFVRDLVDGLLREGNERVAVVGDFNDTLESLPLRIVCGVGRGLDPAAMLAPATSLVATESRFSARHGSTPQLIDHVLLSPALGQRLASCSIFNETLRDHGPYDPDAPPASDSDHALVVAELR
ncbi:MAG: hypothetical protein HOV80_06755 [Polyangiaceae bacterium]|nr:hypothetical protein [Polyangiaceae bacterium]